MAERLDSKIEDLVSNNQGLVRYIIENKFNVSYNDFDDLLSIGNFGLFKAAQTFDESKNIRFATYATTCIKNEILMFLRKQKSTSNDISLDDVVNIDKNGNELTLRETISNLSSNFIEDIQSRESFIKIINIVLNLLSKRDRLIILYKISGVNQHFIAKALNISQSYVSRLESKSVKKLKSHLKNYEQFKEVFSMTIKNNLYRISFSSSDVQNFNKIFADFLRNLKSVKDLSDFKIVCNKERISIFLPAELDSFLFVAQIMQEIDNFSITYVSDKAILDSNDETDHTEKSTYSSPSTLVSTCKPSQDVSEDVKPKKGKSYVEQITEYILTLDSFSTSQVIEHFPNIPSGSVRSSLQYAKKDGLIKSISRGNYEVINKNKPIQDNTVKINS